ncbi:MAG: sugar phosphate isomerase/epimerase [Planctomycetes bacterium]|nr:sugar phosphate isomerase/epimerase [Planctomycetota bacterium]
MTHLTRRTMLRSSAAGLGWLAAYPWLEAPGDERDRAATTASYRIGACDWSLGKRLDPAAFAVAKEIGLDGVEVSFGEPGCNNDLRDPQVVQKYRQAAEQTGVSMASLAMGVLNSVPYASDPRTEQWVADVVDVIPKVGVKNCLLAFFGNGDIKGDRAKQDEVIRRLKRVAPKAEKAGVVLGIESWMNADEHLRIVEAVASPAVRIYYDVANMTEQGYDVPAEIRRLGKQNICQIHMKENGNLLGKGKVDFPRVAKAIEDIDYTGWLILEGATIPGKSLVECYRENRRYLRELFKIT